MFLDNIRNIKIGQIVKVRLATDGQAEFCRVKISDFQYLYEDGDFMVIMDNTSLEQYNIPKTLFGLTVRFLSRHERYRFV